MEENPLSGMSDRDRKMMGLENDVEDSEDNLTKKADKKDKDDQPRSIYDILKEKKSDSEDAKPEKPEKAEKPDETEDTPEVDTPPVPVETLADDEAQQIVYEYAAARTEDLRDELTAIEEDSPEEAAALANAALLETIQDNEAGTEEELDMALAETIEDLDLAADEPEDEPDTTTATATGAGGGRGTTPPTPPTPPPTPPTPVPVPGGPILPPVVGAHNVNVAPTPTPASANTWYPARNRAGDLLLGGAVGYLIGRRRGRINAERRMEPVKEKLEKEVKALHDKVAEREAKIRKLAAAKVQQEPETARPALVQKLEERLERQRLPVPVESAVEQPVPTPERRPEAIGKFALPTAEVAPKSTETMTLPELLQIAERIERDGISVKEMYAKNRLDAIGLRRVVHEYLHGEHLDRVLRDNLRTPESFETLPMVNQATEETAAALATSSTPQGPVEQLAPLQSPTSPPSPAPNDVMTRANRAARQLSPNQAASLVAVTGVVLVLLILAFIGS